MYSYHRYVGKVILVTGAAQGLGKGIAQRFLHEDGKVVLVDRSATVHDTAAELAAVYPDQVHAVKADVTSEGDVASAVQSTVDRWGTIDVLINNAGVITISEVEKLTLDAWSMVLAVNTTGSFLTARACIPVMRARGRGRILNAASGQARQGFIYTPHYAASKFGVIGLTQSLAKELAKDRITVNAYCPGIIGTDMWAYNDREWGRLLGNYAPGELMKEWVDTIPLGRAATADDVANLLLFLGSDEAEYITGQAINIDGGMFMS